MIDRCLEINENKDWIGNKKSTFVTLGASSHSEGEREEHDYYATEPKAIELLLEQEDFNKNIWECAVGEWHLADVLVDRGYNVIGSDIIKRGNHNTKIIDFLNTNVKFNGDIITNPPYSYAKEFIEKSLEIIPEGNKVAMFLKITFLESEGRKQFFKENPPIRIYVASGRLLCGINGDFNAKDKDGNVILNKDGTPKRMSSAACYAWFVWEKGYKGLPTLDWIN